MQEVAAKLSAPRVAWVMVPAGEATNSTIDHPGRSLRRATSSSTAATPITRRPPRWRDNSSSHGIAFVDAGTSGGVWGLKKGYCLMVGGTDEAVRRGRAGLPAPGSRGRLRPCRPPGAGHFVKMVHNGIEYGLMQAYAEGSRSCEAADEFDLDLHQIASSGATARSCAAGCWSWPSGPCDPESGFEDIEGVVVDSGEGRWTVEEAMDRGVSAPVIASALFARFASKKKDAFGLRLVAALRNHSAAMPFTTASGAQGGETFTPK